MPRFSFFRLLLLIVLLTVLLPAAGISQEDLLSKKINIPRTHGSTYDVLNLVASRAGCFFVYDSRSINNENKIRLDAQNSTVKQVLDQIFGKRGLDYRAVGKYILITTRQNKTEIQDTIRLTRSYQDSINYKWISGRILDARNQSAIAFATIVTEDGSTGTISNADGSFKLKVPVSHENLHLKISHIGYLGKCIPVSIFVEEPADIFLEQKIYSFQEVIIRYTDPNEIIRKALEARKINNSLSPVMMTTFYREGVQKDQQLISFSDAVFKIFKSSFEFDETHDQIRLLKSRKFTHQNASDTVFLKLKAGILAGLQLDIVKCIPDFLDLQESQSYVYSYADMVGGTEEGAYAIAFKPAEGNEESRFSGIIYINRYDLAFLGADFSVYPPALSRVTRDYIQKKSGKLKVRFEKITYSVRYRNVNGKYYFSHARSDLYINARLRNHLKGNDFHTFLELVNCQVDTSAVKKFSREQIFRPDVVFSDVPYTYDESFWNDFNSIAPEESLIKALSGMTGKIESAGIPEEQ